MTSSLPQTVAAAPPAEGDLPPSPPAVLHVVLSLDCGGLEHIVLLLCRHALAQGQRVGVVCLEKKGGLAPQLEQLGVEVFCLDKPPGIRWALRSQLAALFNRWRPEIVHTHQIGALFYAGPAARRCQLPVVHTEHGKHYQRGRKLRLLARYAASKCDRFVGVAADVCEHAINYRIVRRSKTRTIENGIDVERFASAAGGLQVRASLGIPSDAAVIGSVGRLAQVKNYPLLMRAFASVHRQHPQTHLLLVGDGPARGELNQLATELGIERAVSLVGYQDDRENYLKAMNVFCLTSHSEGLPLSLLEAMAAGVPVVASQVGGIPDVIGTGRNGLLFPPGDLSAAVKQIASLLESPDSAQVYSQAAQQEIRRRYSSEAMAAAYQSLYQECRGARRQS